MSDYYDFDYYIGGCNYSYNRLVLEHKSLSQSTPVHIHIVPMSNLSRLIKKKRTQGPSIFDTLYMRY